jgi:6-phosphogluconolactonase (cycloisomerase 2 family)
MEINQRMSKRFGWLLGVVVLVSIGLLVACGSKYNSSSDGLILVGSQGSGLIETFRFNLGSGSASAISNSPADTSSKTCVLNGIPSSLVVDPKGTYAYAIINANDSCTGSKTGIAAFKVNSNGSMSAVGNLVPDVNPVALAMDAAGKFLFVAEGANSTPCVLTTPQGGVCVYAIGSGATLTAVPATFTFPTTANAPNFVALAATPTVFPAVGINGVKNSVCSGLNPPTSEYLYAVDAQNYVVWEFEVDTTTGALGNPNPLVLTAVPSVGTDPVPAGIAVDPCDRFVYVTDSLTDKVSAYTICSAVSLPNCQFADGSLVPVSGSPFPLAGSANTPGPLVVDPFGNYVYVLGTLSNTVSLLKISPVSGSVASTGTTTVATGQRPTSITIRGDDNWLFVTNFNSASVSQYAITPSTGELTAQQTIQTDNYPWGVAVK